MKYGSTGSLAPLADAPFAVLGNKTGTKTTFSAAQPNNYSGALLKSGLLAKHLANAGKGYMKEHTKQGAQDVLATADKFGGTGMQGAGGQFGTGAQSPDGEWALGADKFRSGAEAPDWAARQAESVQLSINPGDNVAALDAAGNAAADSAMQGAAEGAATEAAANLGTDVAADVGTNLAQNAATEAATDAASSAAGAIPIAGTALNVGANLAQGKYGAAGGAAAGAALGSIIPGVGTALGGTIGGLLGSFL